MNFFNRWIDQIFKNRVLSHILFWVLVYIVSTIIGSLNVGDVKPNMVINIFMLPLQVIAAYTLAYYQIPKLILTKRYLLFMISFLTIAYVLSFLCRVFVVHLAEPLFRENYTQESILEIFKDPLYLIGVYMPVLYVFPLIFLVVKAVKGRIEEQSKIERLESEKAKAELKFLKAQIHPHFLFNTLNNLYSLTIEKSDQAPEVVIKLSEILDYLLYQCNDERVDLEQEIQLIKNYISLENLRYGDRINVNFNIEDSLANTQIAPLILLSLVENAYKHGASNNMENPIIEMDLKVQFNTLHFKIKNNKTKDTIPSSKGLGLKNLKQQLKLLYPEKHTLVINDQEDIFEVHLSLQIEE